MEKPKQDLKAVSHISSQEQKDNECLCAYLCLTPSACTQPRTQAQVMMPPTMDKLSHHGYCIQDDPLQTNQLVKLIWTTPHQQSFPRGVLGCVKLTIKTSHITHYVHIPFPLDFFHLIKYSENPYLPDTQIFLICMVIPEYVKISGLTSSAAHGNPMCSQ